MPTSPVMQIHVTVSEILWKINISVCISGLLYNIAGISSYNLGILYICSEFLLVYGSFSTRFYSPSVFCFNIENVGTSFTFSWNVFWVVSTSVSVERMVVCRFYWYCNNYLQENYSVSVHELHNKFSKVGSLEAVIVAHYVYFLDLFKHIVYIYKSEWKELTKL